MDKHTIKTTIEIDTDLLYLAKKRALDEQTSLKDIVNQSLKLHLERKLPTKRQISLGGHRLGGVKTDLSRDQIYDTY